MRFLATFDTCVIDELITRMIVADTEDEADAIAYEISRTTAGLSEGNYDLYTEVTEK